VIRGGAPQVQKLLSISQKGRLVILVHFAAASAAEAGAVQQCCATLDATIVQGLLRSRSELFSQASPQLLSEQRDDAGFEALENSSSLFPAGFEIALHVVLQVIMHRKGA
jgi:hypothetical protein